ncbi:MAG: ribonuclease activity regulator RraA [Chloroflexi bacterium]|nr:ribonuclease activity regulator RraA [Chloroflexota bacterium]MCY3937547.1 ribonuclease activity regulator RraA [Chloroflexota bacterium]
MPDDVDLKKLAMVSSPTATHLLLKLGIRNTFLEGIKPLTSGAAVVGRARTLRFLPMREDIAPDPEHPSSNAQRLAIESIAPGEILVVDAGGYLGAGTLGDILCERMKYRGALAVVVDGAVRDSAQIREVGLPVWSKGVHGAASSRSLWPDEYDIPIRCGGCTVMPGDYIIADEDGVVVVPPVHAAHIAEDGSESERREEFIRMKIRDEGYSTTRAYPPNDEVLAEYESWKKGEATRG